MRNYKGKYLIACSGGPDSLALLDMCYKKGIDIYCAHINYHKRKSANRDERIVKKYCDEKNIPFFKKDYKNSKGNFQASARIFRYAYFKELVDKYNLNAVMIAHHLDDHLETYLLQIKHGGDYSYYGLNDKNIVYGVKVIRPLLNKTKDDLLKYCDDNNIDYGIDESNFSDIYQRNKIRHQVIDKMSLKEKKELNEKIKLLNKEKKEIDNKIKKFINDRNKFGMEELLNYKYRNNVLRVLVDKGLSDKYLDDIFKQMKSHKNIKLSIKDYYIVKEYGYIEIFKKIKAYCHKYNDIKCGNYEYYKITKKGNNTQGVTVNKDDFPISIRSFKDGDSIKMRFGNKKINRFFIDNKVSYHDRLTWPIVLNKRNEVILVPGIGSNISHYSTKHNLFVIKLSNTEDN